MRHLTFLTLVLITCACEKEDLSTSNAAELPVVQAYLSPGIIPEVKIFRQVPFEVTTEELITINDLNPILSTEGIDYPLTQVEDGSYRPLETLTIEAGKTYALSFEYAQTLVYAETAIPAKPAGFSRSGTVLDLSDFPFSATDPITFSWDNPDGDFHQILIQYAQTDSIELELFSGRISGGGPGGATAPQQTNTYEVRPFNVSYVGNHRAILYRVTADYAVFAQEDGGTSINLTAPFTNVENGLGIFTGISADTLTFTVRE